MTIHFEHELVGLKEKLLTMASHAEGAVTKAIKALAERDDELARRVMADDVIVDQFEIEIDELSIQLLSKAPLATDLRLITVAMKISHDLERVSDEATTIARRSLELSLEPQLKPYVDIPRMAGMALEMLKDALDAFVNRDTAKARAIIPRDKEVDLLEQATAPRTFQLHGRAAQHHHPLPQPDGHFQEPRTRGRPRHQCGRGSGLSLRSARYPAHRPGRRGGSPPAPEASHPR